jgi:hypothetical protein
MGHEQCDNARLRADTSWGEARVLPPGNADRSGNDRSNAPGHGLQQRGREERGETATGSQSQGSGEEGRRKRPNARYVGWGDGFNREYCDRMSHFLPSTFPVASHIGVATIRAIVVARRVDAYLLCTYDHCGPHVWPGGDVVSDDIAIDVSEVLTQP